VSATGQELTGLNYCRKDSD